MISNNTLPEKRGNIFFRQELTSITPDCRAKCSLFGNFLLILIFLGLGIPIVILQNGTYENKIEYTDW